ncbi:SDR family NAD(P)-dependent oxidoreductase [Pseudoteredinibacter isoporae]|uniref:NAD(P)-dependent dehydrogenase (Short-subunit alcohol dehydrogenase family) n=1 Tax=Pseudoteredinibacter isoporae TaxID=570281 RepID=A0A7X0JR74_9GAMM|nr:SDR family NAD(P)-dependent oxidoreductase [Pseudoteredinibacter isoporae]MBB6520790.1 NAD(P)-dependent dehydrogenase (short-subunit alcohol dehydrogenase family) [Pseudoteredinibacter isoporae]NHO86356.1 SDR family NAD(P)-dependent oxidoreductase [Pseudoteredinibacter isoporae]NIB25192.1 SDR family NAD(P)-dependent oxidoreductase [Pseudoteredinibacter isoporae]
MTKNILITGATDGIGLEAAKLFAAQGHRILLHGRSPEKIAAAESILRTINKEVSISNYQADLSRPEETKHLAERIKNDQQQLDVLVNNAGVFKTPQAITAEGLDTRFVVNVIAPYYLTLELQPLLGSSGRVVNLSSAAQAKVNTQALLGKSQIDDMAAYAQSKLAIRMWTHHLARTSSEESAKLLALNPGSLLASKMVKEGFGVQGHDMAIGAKAIARIALEEDAQRHNGEYFDNDIGEYSDMPAEYSNAEASGKLLDAIEEVLRRFY